MTAAAPARRRWAAWALSLCAAAVLAGCAGGSARPKPAELPPNAALVGVRQAWTARLPAVGFPLQVNVLGQQVTLAGTGAGDYATVAVNDSVKLGGTLTVAFAVGYAPSGGELWKIVEGTGVRTGTFAVENLPENFKVVYTTDGYWIANPALGTTIIIR